MSISHKSQHATIVGAVLCGGLGSRMGGVEKPLTDLHGRALVQHIRARLMGQVSRIVISANREQTQYAQWGDTVIADDATDGTPLNGEPRCGGPLYGVRALLRHFISESRALMANEGHPLLLFCCPGDAPLLDRKVVARLCSAMLSTDADAVYPHDGEQAQHLFVLLRVTEAVASSLDAYLATGARSVHGWLELCRATSVDASDIGASFANINTVRDLDQVAGDAAARSREHDAWSAAG